MKLTNLDILNEDYWFLLYKTGWALIIIFSELPLMPHFLPAVFLQLHTCCQRKILFFVRSTFFPVPFFHVVPAKNHGFALQSAAQILHTDRGISGGH